MSAIPMNTEFEVGGHRYRAEPLDVFQQFNLARRLAPIATVLTAQKDREKLKKGFARAFTALSAGLSDEDSRAILSACLGKVYRNVNGNFAPICPNGIVMLQDFDMGHMLEMVWEVLTRNRLVDFFDVPLSTSNVGEQGQKPSS